MVFFFSFFFFKYVVENKTKCRKAVFSQISAPDTTHGSSQGDSRFPRFWRKTRYKCWKAAVPGVLWRMTSTFIRRISFILMFKFRTVLFSLCRRCFELWHRFSMPRKNEITPNQQKASFRAPSDPLLNQLPWGGSPRMRGGKRAWNGDFKVNFGENVTSAPTERDRRLNKKAARGRPRCSFLSALFFRFKSCHLLARRARRSSTSRARSPSGHSAETSPWLTSSSPRVRRHAVTHPISKEGKRSLEAPGTKATEASSTCPPT